MKDGTEISDVIERSIWIAAAPDAVWDALVNADSFGQWFSASVDGTFERDRTVWAQMSGTGTSGARFWIRPVELTRPERFAYDWPAGDEGRDEILADAPSTRVTFELAEEGEGTRVTVTERGFAAIPVAISQRKYPDNTKGWTMQIQNLKAHVEA